MHTLLHKYYTLECSHPNSEWKNSIFLTSLSSASCQVVVVHSIVLPRFCTLWNSRPNICECFTGPRVIPRKPAVFRGLRVGEGLQRVSGGIGTGVPRSVPASSVPAFRGLTRTRRSTDVHVYLFPDKGQFGATSYRIFGVSKLKFHVKPQLFLFQGKQFKTYLPLLWGWLKQQEKNSCSVEIILKSR